MNEKPIYLDHAATTPPKAKALATAKEVLEQGFYNPSAAYGPARELNGRIEEARETISGLLDVDPKTIIFTSGATEGCSLIIKSILSRFHTDLIASAVEHHAVLNYVENRENDPDFPVANVIRVDSSGTIDMKDLDVKTYWKPKSLVAIQGVNNEIGTIEPLHSASELIHRCGHLLFSDLTQMMGHLPVDMTDIDFAAASGHKFGCPMKNVGFVYAKDPSMLIPEMRGGSQERGVRPGTLNAAGILSMAEALRESYETMDEDLKVLVELRDYFTAGLRKIFPKIYVNSPERKSFPGNLNVRFPGIRSEELLEFLSEHGIYASAGSACNTGERSYVLKAIGLTDEEADECIRFSIGPENTKNEIDTVLSTLVSYLHLHA